MIRFDGNEPEISRGTEIVVRNGAGRRIGNVRGEGRRVRAFHEPTRSVRYFSDTSDGLEWIEQRESAPLSVRALEVA